MRIVETYSHLNGLEFLLVHQKKLWQEIQHVIESVDAAKCKTKISKEKRTEGAEFYAPKDMNKEIEAGFLKLDGWGERRTSYWVTKYVFRHYKM